MTDDFTSGWVERERAILHWLAIFRQRGEYDQEDYSAAVRIATAALEATSQIPAPDSPFWGTA